MCSSARSYVAMEKALPVGLILNELQRDQIRVSAKSSGKYSGQAVPQTGRIVRCRGRRRRRPELAERRIGAKTQPHPRHSDRPPARASLQLDRAPYACREAVPPWRGREKTSARGERTFQNCPRGCLQTLVRWSDSPCGAGVSWIRPSPSSGSLDIDAGPYLAFTDGIAHASHWHGGPESRMDSGRKSCGGCPSSTRLSKPLE